MHIVRVRITNFRGIRSAEILLPRHCVLIGDNNVGKTTLLEALDLALGPDRLRRQPPIDEHDFYQGRYTSTTEPTDSVGVADRDADRHGQNAEKRDHAFSEGEKSEPPIIEIEVTIAGLSDAQRARFGDFIEFWDARAQKFYEQPDPSGLDAETISEALRVTFQGYYDPDDDDFVGHTYYSRSLTDSFTPTKFSKIDKQICGFLYLRSLRTGSRALSLERGSLLDIILRLKEVRPQMWEGTINALSKYSVASDPNLGISDVLGSINAALSKYVPREWGIQPKLKVSNLTRDHLRKVITAFIATGEGEHVAPFYRQGTGTINMLVLAMLTQIAEDKQNVVFAMEEPETAIPPYAQKRIVHEIRQLASQALFTSHSPYVLEEFSIDETVVLSRGADGALTRSEIILPDSVKLKRYRQEFRTRFCEGLLARRVLLAEGATEASAFPVACRRLAELNPSKYTSLEALGICVVDAGADTNISDMAKLYRNLGKAVFAICDKQAGDQETAIRSGVDILLMHEEKGFEDLVLKNTTDDALRRFCGVIDWPTHIKAKYPKPEDCPKDSLREYFGKNKGNWGIAEFVAQCCETEIPEWLRHACIRLREACGPVSIMGKAANAAETSGATASVDEAH